MKTPECYPKLWPILDCGLHSKMSECSNTLAASPKTKTRRIFFTTALAPVGEPGTCLQYVLRPYPRGSYRVWESCLNWRSNYAALSCDEIFGVRTTLPELAIEQDGWMDRRIVHGGGPPPFRRHIIKRLEGNERSFGIKHDNRWPKRL